MNFPQRAERILIVVTRAWYTLCGRDHFIEEVGSLFLTTTYSPEFNPIEETLSKVKTDETHGSLPYMKDIMDIETITLSALISPKDCQVKAGFLVIV